MGFLRKLLQRRPGRRSAERRMNRCQLWVEALEDRTVPSVTVTGVPTWSPKGPAPIIGANDVMDGQLNSDVGEIQAIATDPFNADVVFVATPGGGVWRTTNATTAAPSWRALTDQFPSLAMSTVAISPLDANNHPLTSNTPLSLMVVYAGTGSFNSLGFAGPAVGLLKSTDGGSVWTQVAQQPVAAGGLQGLRIRSVLPTALLDPATGQQVVLVAAIGPADFINGVVVNTGGIFRSADGGRTFLTLAGAFAGQLPVGRATSVVADPVPQVSNAANQLFFAALPGQGIYRGTNGGQTWVPVNTGLTGIADSFRIQLAVNNNVGYAEVIGSDLRLAGVFVSDNLQAAAPSWRAVGNMQQVLPEPQGNVQSAIVADPNDLSRFYISGDISVSSNANASIWQVDVGASASNDLWTPVSAGMAPPGEPHVDSRDLRFDPAGRLLEADDGGIYRLIDPANVLGNRHWESMNGNIQTGVLVDVAYDSLNGIFVSSNWDNGTAEQITSGSTTWMQTVAGDGADVAVDNSNSTFALRYYMAGSAAYLTRREYDFDNGLIGSATVGLASPATPTVHLSGLFNDDRSVSDPFVLNAVDPSRMLIGSNGLYEGEGGTHGDIIDRISGSIPVLEGPDRFGTEGVVRLVYGHRLNPDVIYVVTQGQHGSEIWLRTTAGGSFQQLTQFPDNDTDFIQAIVLDPNDWRMAYVVAQTHVYRVTNAGIETGPGPHENWMNITGNLDQLTTTFGQYTDLLGPAVVYNPTTTPGNGVLLVGTWDGVMRTLNPNAGGNTTWTTFGSNLPNAGVDQLRYNAAGNVLFAATDGRGAWTIPNAAAAIQTPSLLQINGDTDFANENDVIKLQLDPNNPAFLNVFLNSSLPTATVQVATIQQINVNGLGGNNTIIVDFSNGAFSVPGGIHIDGGSGINQLRVIGAAQSDRAQITSNALTVDGSSISYTDVSGLEVDAGAGSNVFTVSGTSATTTINAGTGNSAVNVAYGGLGAVLTVNGGPGTDTLAINDNDNNNDAWTITNQYVLRGGGFAVDYKALRGVTLTAGGGADTYTIFSTAANAPFTLDTGPGNGTINLGSIFLGSLSDILAPVTVNSPVATNTLVLNDQGTTAGTEYSITDSSVAWFRGLFNSSVSFNNLAALTLNGGSGGNPIFLSATGAPVTVNTGTGNNAITLRGALFGPLKRIFAHVSVIGQGGTNQLVLNDSGNTTTTDQVTATGSGVSSNTSGSFFGPGGSLAYSGIGSVSIFTSNTNAGSTITVAPANNVVFNIFGAGQPVPPRANSLIVQPLNGVTMLMPHPTGTSGNYTVPNTSTILVNYSDMQSILPVGLLAVGSGPGLAPEVLVYDPQSDALKYDLHPFSSNFRGGVRVAVGDVNADGIPDIITAQGPGGGTVQVFDGVTGKPLAGPLGSFTPFGPDYRHGLWVAAADVNGDGFADVIVGQDAGGQPEVRIYSGKDGRLMADFLAFDPSFPGGVRVAAAVIKGHHDVITGQGPGGQMVSVFDGVTLNLTNPSPTPAFTVPQPFGPSYAGGVFVGTGDVYGDGTPKILVGQGAGPDPEIAIFDGTALGKELNRLVVYGFSNGVRVAAADLNGDSRADVIAGQAQGGANVRAYDGLSLAEDGHLNAFSAASPGGVFVGGFGHWGDFANLTGRTLSGPQGKLQTVVTDLTTIATSLANSGDRRRLAEALDLLYTAFNSPAWVDSSQLQADRGRDVFAAEEAAIDTIADLIQHPQGAVPGQQLEDALRQLAQSDEELAQIAIANAQDHDSEELRKAKAALLEGQNDFAAAFATGAFNPNRLDDAMDHFREAWEDALKAQN
jgi:hypothetical protein